MNEKQTSIQQIGITRFKQQLTSQQIAQLSITKKEIWLQQQLLDLSNENFISQYWEGVFELIENTGIVLLNLECNYLKQIPKQIHQVNFSKLEIIKISNNQIYNIESLSFINMPLLKSFKFDNNSIIQVKQLSKTKFSQLEGFSIFSNYINLTDLNRIKVCKNMLQIESEALFEKPTIQDLRDYAKIQSAHMFRIEMNPQRVKQQKAENILEQKLGCIMMLKRLKRIYS